VHLAVQNEPQWRRLCAEVVRQPSLADDPRFRDNPSRVANRAELHAVLDAAFKTTTAEELLTALDAADVPAAQTRDLFEVAAHPQLAARDRWARLPVPDGGAGADAGAGAGAVAGPGADAGAGARATVPVLRPPVDSDGWGWSPAAVPAVGEHTDAVLAWLGYRPDEIAALHDRGAV